jgi:hypothetical protein
MRDLSLTFILYSGEVVRKYLFHRTLSFQRRLESKKEANMKIWIPDRVGNDILRQPPVGRGDVL